MKVVLVGFSWATARVVGCGVWKKKKLQVGRLRLR